MNDRSRWDPEMVANQQRFEELAAKYPPVQPVQPLGPHRHVNELLNLPYAKGGPEMAETRDRWVMGRGRRILCSGRGRQQEQAGRGKQEGADHHERPMVVEGICSATGGAKVKLA